MGESIQSSDWFFFPILKHKEEALEEDYMEEIECTKCSEVKVKSEFYSCKRYSTGIRQPCKDCVKLADKKSREKYTLAKKVVPEEKECGTCKEVKPSDCFAKRADTPTGLRSDCKDCLSIKGHNIYEGNKEHVLWKTNQYRLEHLEDYSRWKRERYWKDPELARAKDAEYRDKNRERVNKYSRDWCRENPEKRKLVVDKYLSVEANKEKAKESSRRWRAKNKDLICYYASNRRAKILKATPPWSDKEVIKSFYKEANYLNESVDHIIPLSHPLVCGLHVEYNLQSMPLQENISKNNTFEICEHEIPEWFEEDE